MYAGKATIASGFPCDPTSPASMSVIVGEGVMTKWTQVDPSKYGSLPADSDMMLKVGVLSTTTTFSMTAPLTPGHSVDYLIQGQFTEFDTDSVLLPYYNEPNPNVPIQGDGGNPQPTTRKATVALQLKTGTSAPTGTQSPPTHDAGFSPLWTITVNYGQTSIGTISIVKHSGFPTVSLADTAYKNTVTFTASGNFVFPGSQTTTAQVEVVGGGGGGGGARVDGAAGGGGGGGYARAYVQLVPGQTYPVIVGLGGAAGGNSGAGNGGSYPNPPDPLNAGGAGGMSSFASLIMATGGAGGIGSGSKGTGTGGAPGTGSFAGGVTGSVRDGGWADGGYIPGGGTGGRGGLGGGSGFGGGGGRNGIGIAWGANGTPQNGGKYGGGGGGGGSGNTGGAGGDGVVIISYS
jgi:hypothetical protein